VKFGLNQSDLTFLNQNLVQPLKDRKAKVFIFGSRAIGKHHQFSDVDLLFVEDPKSPIDSSFISNLITLFEESRFPYKIDLVNDRVLAKSYRPSVENSKIEL
jgi:predicted nucleotidyltransferase